MKRNDFVTNVLKCNNFHCLASSEASVSKSYMSFGEDGAKEV